MKIKNSILGGAALIVLSWFGSSNAFALSPPWIVLQNELKATLQADDCVQVGDVVDVPGGYDINVHVCHQRRAVALATLVYPTRSFGNVKVHIHFFGPHSQNPIVPTFLPSNPEEASEVIQTALHANRYFVQVGGSNPVIRVFIEFHPRVVQFYADNLADAYNNINLTAADAFKDALGLEEIHQIAVGTTTSPKDE